MEINLRTVIALCLVYSSLADDIKTGNEINLGNRLSEDVKEYISMLMSDTTEKHNRDIRNLKAIIDSQETKIKELEIDNQMKSSSIRELEKRVENIVTKTDYNKHNGNYDNISDRSTADKISSENEINRIKRNNSARQDPPSQSDSRIDRKRRTNVENEVAFFAAMSNHSVHLGQAQDIVFDDAITNIGNAYNPNHGTFIAPTSGVYVFAVTLFHHSNLGTSGSWGKFIVRGQRVAMLHVNLEQSSQTIVVKLKVGDDVSIQNTHTDRGFYGNYYSTFSGFLLYEDFSAGTIVG